MPNAAAKEPLLGIISSLRATGNCSMKELRRYSAVLAITATLTGCGASKSSIPAPMLTPASKMYQATYSSPDNVAYQTQHIYRDGKGHIRVDISGRGPTCVHVLDMNKDETTIWTEGVSEYVRRPAQSLDPLIMRVRMETMQNDGMDLGSKN